MKFKDHVLPLKLQQKFRDKVTDTLLPKSCTHTYNHIIELKPDNQLPKLLSYHMHYKLKYVEE